MASFSGLLSRRILPKDWFQRLNELDPREAWLIVHFQIQVQHFRHHFFVLKDLNWSSFYTPWSLFIPRHDPKRYKLGGEGPWLCPIGHMAKMVRRCKGSLKERGKISWVGESWEEPYHCLVLESHAGITKEIEIEIVGMRHVTTPVLAPNQEVEFIPGLMGQLRGSPGHDPSEFYLIHDVVMADNLKIRIKIGTEERKFSFPRQILAFQLTKYRNTLTARFPDSLLRPANFEANFLSPYHVKWPYMTPIKEEEAERDRIAWKRRDRNPDTTPPPSALNQTPGSTAPTPGSGPRPARRRSRRRVTESDEGIPMGDISETDEFGADDFPKFEKRTPIISITAPTPPQSTGTKKRRTRAPSSPSQLLPSARRGPAQ